MNETKRSNQMEEVVENASASVVEAEKDGVVAVAAAVVDVDAARV